MASVSFSVKDSIAEKLDKYRKKNGLGSRTQAIEKLLQGVQP